MDTRLDPAPVVLTFAATVRPVVDVVAVYAGGSLAGGDFHPGISDLDLVAVISDPLDAARQRQLRRFHQTFRRARPDAAKLQCAYVPQGEVGEFAAAHPIWAQGHLRRRPLSPIARAELLSGGIVVHGPPPAELLPPIDRAALHAAVRADLDGYWSWAVRRPAMWLTDWCVDLGLVTLARAEVTLRDGRLITKREALGRLDRFDVPAELAAQIVLRREGTNPRLSATERVKRAHTARRLVTRGLRTLGAIEAHPRSDSGEPGR